jgi:hypothetical protein
MGAGVSVAVYGGLAAGLSLLLAMLFFGRLARVGAQTAEPFGDLPHLRTLPP